MLGLLGVVGFLAFVIFGIMWIVSLVKKNGKAIRNILISIAGLVVMIIASVVGIGSAVNDALSDTTDGPKKVDESQEEAPKDNMEAEDNATEEETVAEENTEFSIGEKVELDGQIVEVTKVEKSSGNDFDKPQDGKEFVIVHVSIENEGDKEISYNPFNFKMQNSNGQIESQTITTIDSDTSLSSGNLAPGGNVSGTIAFEQPIDDEALQLIFEANFWSNKEIIFNLQ